MAPSRNYSCHSDLSLMAVGAPELVKVQICVDGRLKENHGKWGYEGGRRLFQTVTSDLGYSDLMYKMCEKLKSDVALKYLSPGTDVLVDVADDDDVQEMFREYWRGLSSPGVPQGFRLTVILEQALAQDLYEEGEAFFSSSAEKVARASGNLAHAANNSSVTQRHSSYSSDGSSINSAAAGMHMTPRLIGPAWTQPESLPEDDPDASDASHAYQQLGNIHHIASDLGIDSFQKPGFEFAPYQANLDYSIGKGYGSQDQRFHTQGDSYAEADTDGTTSKKTHDPVSVLPSHLYSTDDEQSTQHAMSGSNSANMQPHTSMQTSAKDLSLHLPSISDIYAVIDENQKALAASTPADGKPDNKGNDSMPLSANEAPKPGRGCPMEAAHSSISPHNINVSTHLAVSANPFAEPGGRTDAASVVTNAAVAPSQMRDGLAFGRAGMTGARLQSPQLNGSFRSQARPPARPYSPLFHPLVNLLPHPTPASPFQNISPPQQAVHPNGTRLMDAYGNLIHAPLAYPNAAGAPLPGGEFIKYQPGQHLNGLDVSCGQAQFGGGPLGAQQGAWMKHDKYMPAVQYIKEHSLLTHASSGGSGTLNNPVHKVPKEEVKILLRIGEGAFGEVSLATCAIFGSVAVKWLKPGKVERHSQSFWREAEMLSNLNHPNVLRFYGVVVESHAEPNVIGIMTEYMKGGSLSAFLRTEGWLNLRCRAEMALSAVNGLAYLHEMGVVHFDLKPDNLLLDGKMHDYMGNLPSLKVADFGLSKHKWGKEFVSGVRDLRGTLPYMAPELVSDPERVSEKADVWSLGMVLWEMLTRQVPFTHLTPQQIIAGLMVGNLQPEVPEWCEPEWRSVMESCWEVNPDHRPSLRELARRLEHIIQHA